MFKKRAGLTERLTSEMGESCDLTHPRLVNSVVLQCIVTLSTSIVSTLYDGMDPKDIDLLLLECAKLCVTRWKVKALRSVVELRSSKFIVII